LLAGTLYYYNIIIISALVASAWQTGLMTGKALLTVSVLVCLAALAYGITWQGIRLSGVTPFSSRSRGSLSQATWQQTFNYVLTYGRTVRPLRCGPRPPTY